MSALSSGKGEKQMINRKIAHVAEKIVHDGESAVSYEDACELAALPETDTMDLLFCANNINKRFKKSIIVCSIINAKSGLCSEDCAFCAQSSHHQTGIETHPFLKEDDIVEHALRMHEAGATKYSMVTSGYMLTDEEVSVACGAAATIIEKTGITICASPGMITASMARRLNEGGITFYHHNLETARSYFPHMCTTHSYDEDIQAVRIAKASGMKVCSGGILGLGETWEQRVELACTVRDLNVDGIPINFLNPIRGTKMENRPLLSPAEALKCIALFRLINPGKDIIICGGREVTLRDYQSWIFLAALPFTIIIWKPPGAIFPTCAPPIPTMRIFRR
jgi:biotin synthase